MLNRILGNHREFYYTYEPEEESDTNEGIDTDEGSDTVEASDMDKGSASVEGSDTDDRSATDNVSDKAQESDVVEEFHTDEGSDVDEGSDTDKGSDTDEGSDTDYDYDTDCDYDTDDGTHDYSGSSLLEIYFTSDNIMQLVDRLTHGGVTTAAARKLVQQTLHTCYTPDRAEATLLQLEETFDMLENEVFCALSGCLELLVFPPESLPGRLENVRSLTAMSPSQAMCMVQSDVGY